MKMKLTFLVLSLSVLVVDMVQSKVTTTRKPPSNYSSVPRFDPIDPNGSEANEVFGAVKEDMKGQMGQWYDDCEITSLLDAKRSNGKLDTAQLVYMLVPLVTVHNRKQNSSRQVRCPAMITKISQHKYRLDSMHCEDPFKATRPTPSPRLYPIDPKGKEAKEVYAAVKGDMIRLITHQYPNSEMGGLLKAMRATKFVAHQLVYVLAPLVTVHNKKQSRIDCHAIVSKNYLDGKIIYVLESMDFPPKVPKGSLSAGQTTKKPAVKEEDLYYRTIKNRDAQKVYDTVKSQIISNLSGQFEKFNLADRLSVAWKQMYNYKLIMMVKVDQEKKPRRYVAWIKGEKVDKEIIYKLEKLEWKENNIHGG